jgi:hypothetical protein
MSDYRVEVELTLHGYYLAEDATSPEQAKRWALEAVRCDGFDALTDVEPWLETATGVERIADGDDDGAE